MGLVTYGQCSWSKRLGNDYPALLAHVKKNGDVVSSRLGEAREILNMRLQLWEPAYCLVGRDHASRAFIDEEIIQLLAGSYDYTRLYAIVPKAAELITAATAYGPRTWKQLRVVSHELEIPDTRRAVVYVGDRNDLLMKDDPSTAAEMPCTMTWQFNLRDGKLHMAVAMRSWDLVWGLTSDVPSFVAVQMMLADHLDVRLGSYTHTAGSAHVYAYHYDVEAWPTNEKLEIPWLKGSVAKTQEYANGIMTGVGGET